LAMKLECLWARTTAFAQAGDSPTIQRACSELQPKLLGQVITSDGFHVTAADWEKVLVAGAQWLLKFSRQTRRQSGWAREGRGVGGDDGTGLTETGGDPGKRPRLI